MTTDKKSRKQEILDAALLCFTELGVGATTIDMIRERSGASVGSLYHHFGSKESIALAVYVDAMRDHHERLTDLLGAAKNVEAGVKAITFAYVDWVADNPDKARFVLQNRGELVKGGVAGELETQNRAHFAAIMDWFRPHIESGRLKKLPLELYGSLLIGAAHDYARLWLSGRAKTDIREYREIFADAAWRAVKPVE